MLLNRVLKVAIGVGELTLVTSLRPVMAPVAVKGLLGNEKCLRLAAAFTDIQSEGIENVVGGVIDKDLNKKVFPRLLEEIEES